MKYIQQAYKGIQNPWKFAIPIGGFIGMAVLNLIVLQLMDVDVEALLKAQVEEEGATRVLFNNLIVFAFFLAGLFAWVKFVHKQSLLSLTTSRSRVDWGRIVFAFGLWGGITALMIFLGYYLFPEEVLLNFNLEKFIVLSIAAVLLIPIQTSFEEYFFRGYFMQGIGYYTKSTWFAVLISSVVFGLMHIANPEVEKLGMLIMVYYIGTGIFLGIVTIMDEGLELAIGFHAANNLVTALLVTADWTVFQTDSVFIDISEPELGYDVFIPVFILFPLLLFVFSKRYNWSGWKEKFFDKVRPPIQLNEDEFIA